MKNIRFLHRGSPWPWQSKAQRIWYRICAVCLAVFFAYAAFVSRSGIFQSGAETLAALLWFIIVAAVLYAGLNWLSARPLGKRSVPDHRARLHLGVFAAAAGVSLATLLVFLAAANPGGVSVDSAVQWTQANTGRYSNWHPVFHTLLLRLCVLVTPSYTFALLVQCVFFSLSLGYLVATLHAWGINKWLLLAAAAVVTASPIVGNTLMYLWKDNAMTIGVILLTAQGVNVYYSRGGWLRSWRNAAAFGLALAFTTMVRHNAFFFTLPLLLMVLFTCRRQLRFTLTAAAVLITALALVWGPLYAALPITYPNNTVEEAIGIPMTVLCDVRAQNPDALDAETLAFTNAMADETSWESYQLHNYNSIKFGTARGVVSHATLTQILRMTVNTIKADPAAAFAAVNGVTDLVWGLDNEGDANITVRNSGHLPTVPKYDGRLNHIGAALKALITAPFSLNLLGWYFGNIGVSFALMLVFALRALRRSGTRALLLCLPVLIYNLGTMCLLCGKDARFFAFSPLLCTFTFFVLLRDAAHGKPPEASAAVMEETV